MIANTPKILSLGLELEIANDIHTALEYEGYQAITPALEKIECKANSTESVFAVIIDHSIVYQHGWRVLSKLRKCRSIPIIVFFEQSEDGNKYPRIFQNVIFVQKGQGIQKILSVLNRFKKKEKSLERWQEPFLMQEGRA